MPTVREFLIHRNRLVEENMDLVRTIARAVVAKLPPSFELDDLVQAGALGLMDAATKYDEGKGVPFRAYAAVRIRGEIKESCRRRRYRENTHEELDLVHHDRPDMRSTPIDERAHQHSVRKRIRQAMDGLDDKNRAVIEIYFRRDQRLRGVGRAFGVRQSRSSQLLQIAKKDMKRALEMRNFTMAAA